jgi:hypothetical protein
LGRVDKLHCSGTMVEALGQRYWRSGMAHDPRLLARNVYDSPAKYESSNRVGRLIRENCRLSASISPAICLGSLDYRAGGLDDWLPENQCRLYITKVRSSALLCCMTDRYDNRSASSKLGIATSARLWILAVPTVSVL